MQKPALQSEAKKNKPRGRRIWRLLLEFIVAFAVLGVALYAGANFGALKSKVGFWWGKQFGSDIYFKEEVAGLGAATEIIPPDDRIVIPKINVNVPLLFPGSSETEALLTELDRGVIHYPGTAMPGELGNVFVSGHSSQYAWSNGSYKNIFSLINELQPTDPIIVYYQQEKFIYQVTGQKIVSPNDFSVLDESGGHELSLMTCWPAGTLARRLVVTAELVPPDGKSSSGTGDAVDNLKTQLDKSIEQIKELPPIR